MKAVLISIRPKWCELIASGKKTIEVRKSKPKLEEPFKVYIYCTQGDALAPPCLNVPRYSIHRTSNGTVKGRRMTAAERMQSDHLYANGKIIGEFVCNRLTYIEAGYDTNGNKHLYNTAFIEHRMCIPDNELHAYLFKDRDNCGGWAWHISDLAIYDKPKELSEFWAYNEKLHKRYDVDDDGFCCYDATNEYGEALTDCGDAYNNILNCYHCWEEWSGWCHRLTRPPQSWCYVEET